MKGDGICHGSFGEANVGTGIRRGELLALHRADVDLEAAFVQIRFTVQHFAGAQVLFSPPKIARSRRKVALSARAVAALRKHCQRQEQQRALIGAAWVDDDLVFTNWLGEAVRGNHILQRKFSPIL